MSIRTSLKNPLRALRTRYMRSMGLNALYTNTFDAYQSPDYATDNNWPEKSVNSGGTDIQEIWRYDSDNKLRFGGEQVAPMMGTINFPLSTSASIVTEQFFIAPFPMKITSIDCIFAVTNGAALTAFVTKDASGIAPGAGNPVMTGTFNLNATAQTLQSAALPTINPATVSSVSVPPYIILATGDRLSFKMSTTVTSLAGLCISIGYTPGGKNNLAVYNMQANGDLVDQTFFIANRDYIVTAAYACVSTAGTNGSAVNVQVVKDTSTNAPGAGTDLLTNNTNAGFNLKNTINTIETGALTATAASLRLAPGDRLSCDFAGTLTAVAGVVVVVALQSVLARKEVTFTLSKNANLADQQFYVADRNYEIIAISEVHSVAGTDGSAVSLQVTRDTATDAPGAGTDLLSNGTNVGFDLKGTANTVAVGTFKDTRFNFLMAGDRASVDFAGTLTTLAGVTVTMSLVPR